jgi:hypothetical protein
MAQAAAAAAARAVHMDADMAVASSVVTVVLPELGAILLADSNPMVLGSAVAELQVASSVAATHAWSPACLQTSQQ